MVLPAILRYIGNLPNKFVRFGISETIGNKTDRNDKVLHCCGDGEVLHLTYDLHKEDCTVWICVSMRCVNH